MLAQPGGSAWWVARVGRRLSGYSRACEPSRVCEHAVGVDELVEDHLRLLHRLRNGRVLHERDEVEVRGLGQNTLCHRVRARTISLSGGPVNSHSSPLDSSQLPLWRTPVLCTVSISAGGPPLPVSSGHHSRCTPGSASRYSSHSSWSELGLGLGLGLGYGLGLGLGLG